MPLLRFCAATISLLKVGVRAMLNNDKSSVTPHVTETLIPAINNKLGANTILNPKVEFKNQV
jgi:hypothetical protein